VLWGANRAAAQTLYVASGSNGVAGQLHTINPANGATVSTIGPLIDATGAPYGLTGLAFHPTNGTLYGSVANFSDTNPGFLVRVNPATAQITTVGAFGAGITGTLADISFASDGTLYGWESAGQHRLVSVNLATGTATGIGAGLGSTFFGGGGLAARPSDNTVFSSPDGSTGPRTLRTVDRVTGVSTIVGPLTGLPPGFLSGSLNAMDFNNAGTLFGLLSDRGGVAQTHLVTINQTTAALTSVGLTQLTDLDAMAFQRIPEPGSLSLLAAGALSALTWRRRRN
jgi:hypothetical protein